MDLLQIRQFQLYDSIVPLGNWCHDGLSLAGIWFRSKGSSLDAIQTMKNWLHRASNLLGERGVQHTLQFQLLWLKDPVSM